MSSKFTFYYGCMGSGKSLDLIRTAYNYKEKGLKFEAFKPKTDTREGSDECVISTRVGLTIPAHWLEEDKNSLTNQLLQYKDADVILVDEAQFLSKEQVMTMKYFSLENDIPFIFYGLKVDFSGEQFEGTRVLRSYSEKEHELKTMCSCGKPAKQNARVVDGKIQRTGKQVAIEGDTKYVALCNKCYLTKEEI